MITWRSLAVTALSLVMGCANIPSEEPTAGEGSALQDDADYIGDRGGEGPREYDPTKARGFSITENKPAPAPAKAVLSFTWFGQSTHYWCGPGSMRMALSTHLPNPLPSQQDLADFMGTTTEGTVRADAIRALNNYLAPPAPYAAIPVDTQPTQAQRDLLKKSVVARIASGWPVIANVLSGWRPPGYPSGTIGHFVAVMGYDDNGDKVLIADPAAAGSGGSRWEDVPKTYWISIQNLGTWVGGRGYSGDVDPNAPPPDPTPVPAPTP